MINDLCAKFYVKQSWISPRITSVQYWCYASAVLMLPPAVLSSPLSTDVSPCSTDAIPRSTEYPPQYWRHPPALLTPSPRITDAIPPQYWRHPPAVLMLPPAVLMLSPHSTEPTLYGVNLAFNETISFETQTMSSEMSWQSLSRFRY